MNKGIRIGEDQGRNVGMRWSTTSLEHYLVLRDRVRLLICT